MGSVLALGPVLVAGTTENMLMDQLVVLVATPLGGSGELLIQIAGRLFRLLADSMSDVKVSIKNLAVKSELCVPPTFSEVRKLVEVILQTAVIKMLAMTRPTISSTNVAPELYFFRITVDYKIPL